jgi:hypothetical protein
MTALTPTRTTLGFPSPGGEAGSVDYDHTASFVNHVDQDIRCTSGHLWVTLENDPIDFVLNPGECLYIAGRGRVVIGGRGAYRIGAEVPLAMAS